MTVRDGEVAEEFDANQPSQPSRPARDSSEAWLVAALLLLAFLPYLNTLHNGFVYDDHHEVEANPYIRSFSHVGDIFSTRTFAHLGARGATNYYRPIVTLGFLICCQLSGLLPYAFHLFNLELNALMVCLLYGVSKRLFRDRWVAFTAAAIFALHPIHTESVDWVAGVTDIDLGVFYLATFWCFLASARGRGGRSEGMQLGMAGCFVLALLCKEQAATLPVAATIFEHFYRDDRAATSWQQKAGRYGVLWLLVVAYVLFRISFFGAFAPVQLTPNVTWMQAILSAAPLAALYVFKVLWPVRLMAFYAFHKSVTPFDTRVLAGVLVLAFCALAFTVLWKRQQLLSFGLVWFFLNIAPVLNSRWLGPNVFTERYLYLPSVGICWLAAWGVVKALKLSPGRNTEGRAEAESRMASESTRYRRQMTSRQIAVASGAVVVAALAFVRIVIRNREWHDDGIYYRVALAQAPEATNLRTNLGAVYWEGGRPEAAEREWKIAYQASPHGAVLLNNLGLVSARKMQYDQAMADFQEAARRRPIYSDAHLNLGRLYILLGRTADAELQLRAAVGLAPLDVDARNALGAFYLGAGRGQEAQRQFAASAASIPNLPAFDALGDLAGRDGRRADAEHNYRAALKLDPFDTQAHFGLASVLDADGRGVEAVEEYRAGLNMDPNNQQALAALERLSGNSHHVKTAN